MRRNNESSTALRRVDLNLLKVFDAILREQSISQAAVFLCVSQPAVSNALRRLRELYNDPLFVRTATGMMPTPKAQELSGPIDDALNQINKTMALDDDFVPESSHRVFNIAMTDYGESYFLPKILQQLEKQAPSIEIVCSPSPGASLNLEMKSGAIDFVWDWVQINDPDYFEEPIFEDAGYCLVRKGHPMIDGELGLDLFLEVSHVALLPTRQRNPRIERALDELTLKRNVGAEVSNLLVMPEIVAGTDLVATMPERLARKFGKAFDLQVIPNPVYQDSVVVYQMWHRHFEEDEGHKWFRNLAKQVASEC